MTYKLAAVLAVAMLAGGCAAVFDGTTQQIAVNTSPTEAHCKFVRNGSPIADISSTPSAVTIQKTKHDITITCSKPGYSDATFINKSGVAGATFGNILGGVLTGGIAWAIDSSSGADNKYESQVNMTLAPLGALPPAQAPVGSSPTVPPTASGPTTSGGTTFSVECVTPDGSKVLVSGGACPPGWTTAGT